MAILAKQTNQTAKSKATLARQTKKTAKSEGVELPLNKTNFILMGACLLLIVVGFFMMSGSANEGDTFNEDIFSSTRTVVGPFIAFLGFILMAFAIMYKDKNKNQE